MQEIETIEQEKQMHYIKSLECIRIKKNEVAIRMRNYNAANKRMQRCYWVLSKKILDAKVLSDIFAKTVSFKNV